MLEYRHLISGEAFGAPHEPGDPVAAVVPDHKLGEWLEAGVIEPVPVVKTRQKTKPREGTNTESQETSNDRSEESPDGKAASGAPE